MDIQIKEFIPFLAGMLLFLLVLSRYIVNGEPVDVRSSIQGTGSEAAEGIAETAALYDDREIVQPLTVPAESSWRQGYYALFFSESDRDSEGELILTLEQGERQDTRRILLREIQGGEWTSLRGLPFEKLESGPAALYLRTEGVAAGELEIAAGPDHYGFGNFSLDGNVQQTTLAQAYHYHITGTEYTVRLVCYGVVLLCVAVLVFLVLVYGRAVTADPVEIEAIRQRADGAGAWHLPAGGKRAGLRQIGGNGIYLIAFGVLTVLFMAVIYVIDSSIYLEPTYAEAVSNFLHFAREEKLTANLLIADAGYLPLLPRLITLFYVKLLRVPSAWALYFMQATACLLCSMVWAFFVLPPFRGLMRFPNRILWCLLVMMTCFCEETLFFTNHAYWGIYLLLLLLAARLEDFPAWIYAVLLGSGALICLSKGTYAVMLPLTVLYLVFFWKSIGGRDRLFACVTGGASLLQLFYSFSGQGDGGGWIDAASMGQADYWLRLCGRLAVEFGAALLAPFGEILGQVSFAGIAAAAVGTAVLVALAAGFVLHVLFPLFHGKRIDRPRISFYTTAMFLLIVSAFFLVTVKRVPDSWEAVAKIKAVQMGGKYEIFSNVGFYMLLVTGCALVREKTEAGRGGFRVKIPDAVTEAYGVLLLLVFFCLTNPVMRLTGWAGAETSDGRVYAGGINTAWQDGKAMISESSFFLPVRGEYWAYSRNCNLYQVGTAFYFEETSCFNLEETAAGWHSFYEIQEETQAQDLIEVMIERPLRVDLPTYRVRLLDAEGNVLAETEQLDSGRNKKCLFRFAAPVSGVKTIELTEAAGNPAYFRDYIAWACAW